MANETEPFLRTQFDKNVKGEIVNRTCHSLNRRLLESSFKEFTF